jgi:transcriptional regulator
VRAGDRLLAGILGLHLTVTAVQAKFKFGGTKKAPVRERVAGRLKNGSAADERARSHLLRRSGP